jgi:hypothetical protein
MKRLSLSLLFSLGLIGLLWPVSVAAQSCTGGCNPVAWPETNPVWEFCWIPASASSGINGSGIEIRDVKYNGRLVLKRGHAPILNVDYDPGGCGCFRDWLDQEVTFIADGVVNSCYAESTPGTVQTVCDTGGSGGDVGSFTGVSSESYADQLVLTTQAEAGWYRYTMRWHFYLDGRIQPEFAFASVPASCVNNTHNHHVYWRLDFDIEGASDDYVVETSDAGADLTFATETVRTWGDPLDNVGWSVLDALTGRGYHLEPGLEDYELPVDEFSKLDAFFTLYRPNELDDSTFQCEIQPNGLVNGEAIDQTDVVLWYRTGHRHLGGDLDTCDAGGPMLTPLGDWGQDGQAAVTVAVAPLNPPVEIPPEGGSFAFDLTVVNTTTSAQTTDLWLSITNDGGVDVTRGPFNVSLDASGSLFRTVTQKVPAGAPAGTYTYTASVGAFPVADQSDSFTFEKLAGAAAAHRGDGRWTLFDASTGTPVEDGEAWSAEDLRATGSRVVPSLFGLEQNYPNPFRTTTTIRYALKEPARVTLKVYNALGREVRTLASGVQAGGFRSVVWDGRDDAGAELPSGTYFYKLRAGDFEKTRLMILLK